MNEFRGCRTVGELIERYVAVEIMPPGAENRALLLGVAEGLVVQELCAAGPVVCQGKVWYANLPVRMGRFDSFRVRDAYAVPTTWTEVASDPATVVNADGGERCAGWDGSETPS